MISAPEAVCCDERISPIVTFVKLAGHARMKPCGLLEGGDSGIVILTEEESKKHLMPRETAASYKICLTFDPFSVGMMAACPDEPA